jgi:hypothetical protein
MHGVTSAVDCSSEHLGAIEVALAGMGRPDDDGLVGEPGGQRLGVGLADREHRLNAQFAGRSDYADRDFASIRDQQPADAAWGLVA